MPHDRARPQRPVRPKATVRSAVFLAAGVLALPALAGCGADDETSTPAAAQDVAPAARDLVADGGTVKWAVDALPETFNTFQSDADDATSRVAGAVLPSLYRLDAQGRVQRNPDFLETAKVVESEPKQVVLYKLNQQAVWSDGREIGADDFAAQWRALSGKDSAYWTARNAGYDRIEKIERGANNLEVRVTFAQPYADWRSLFSPLYPKEVMGTPDSFNDGARTRLKVTAGPFALKDVDRAAGEVTLRRSPRWWGSPAKLDALVLREVPRERRAAALAAGKVDLADVDADEAGRIALAARDKGDRGPLTHGPGARLTPADALRSWARAHGTDEEAAAAEQEARERTDKAVARYADEQAGLRGYTVRKSLEPAYTQLALNGAEGPLADDRVRRAVARALNRTELAETVLKPLGLPALPVGSHLALAGQDAYADNSGALGDQDTAEARALLADAGWTPGGPLKDKLKRDKDKDKKENAAGSEAEAREEDGDDGTYVVGEDDQKPGDSGTSVLAPAPAAAFQQAVLARQADALTARRDADKEQRKDPGAPAKKHARKHAEKHAEKHTEKHARGGAPGAYAPKGTAAPKAGKGAGGPLAKDGKPLTLRFVLPSGDGSQALRGVADRISRMLERIGVRMEIAKVADESYFKDHIASGQYDLALYSWPASAFPATDARPIFAKPVPAADGSLNVEQNYTRVGTDHIDQLFDQALAELDEGEMRSLVKKADARIWAAAGSIPLYQRPQLVAARPNLANAGAFGFATPLYEDMGYRKPGAGPAESPSRG
ncbi:putative monoacyl phosphatidylinositol tetramannoside-binding protein LpqW precursor [Streptomyces sp. YIM 121038]|uniref:ABC transporter family substrate-binding protein n=1 Tax=Streptomyces sp. YIM 121038 TaxID=2136401 RepID=UPI00111004B4|nr:ABC transporter family substrate-binding protein [Streptomyces sp. YIM 121038]QCX78890.1 putative monoacyl phosphatidylinositol tetramannoside-binding protein LpqW precursor [Streptomyces sp. YIM 121038]